VISPRPTLVADAAFCREQNVAALAFAYQDDKLLGTEIVSAQSANHAEALAVLRATSFIASRRLAAGQVILTDSLMTVRAVDGRNSGEQFFMQAIKALRVYRDFRGFKVRHAARQDVRTAHSAAFHTLRAWKIGAGLKERWEQPWPEPIREPAPA
jgi:hypothetical protein